MGFDDVDVTLDYLYELTGEAIDDWNHLWVGESDMIRSRSDDRAVLIMKLFVVKYPSPSPDHKHSIQSCESSEERSWHLAKSFAKDSLEAIQ